MDNRNPTRPLGPDGQHTSEPIGSGPEQTPGQGYMPPASYEPMRPDPTAPQAIYAGSAPATAPQPGKKRSKTGVTVSLAALLVLLIAALAGFWFFKDVASRPAVAVDRLLPADTMAYLTMDTAPSGAQKAALDKMRAAFESQPGFKEAWAKLAGDVASSGGRSAQDASGIDGFDAISQYLGKNLTLAMLPLSTADLQKLTASGSSGGGDMQAARMEALMNSAVGIVDLDFNPLNKKGPLLDLKQRVDQAGKTELVEKYREVEVRKYVTGTNTLYFALLNGTSTAVVGGKVQPVRAIIDQFKDNKGLGTDAAFQSLTAQVPKENLASLYVNLTEVYKLAKLSGGDSMLPGGAGLLSGPNAQLNGSVLVSLSAHDDGMQIDVASQSSTSAGPSVNPNAKPGAGMVSDVPAGSLGFLVGTDLKTTIQSTLDAIRKQSQASPDGTDMVTQGLNGISQATGLDVEKDVLPLLGGDYALSVSASDKAASPSAVAYFQLKLSAADQPKAAQVLDKVIQQDPQATKLDTPDGTFYTLSPDTGAAVGVSKDRLVFVYDMDPTGAGSSIKTLLDGAGKGLGTTAPWQEVSKHLPQGSNAIVYVDVTRLRTMAEGTMAGGNQDYEQTAAPFLRPVKYLVLGSVTQPASGDNMSHNHSVMFLGIGK